MANVRMSENEKQEVIAECKTGMNTIKRMIKEIEEGASYEFCRQSGQIAVLKSVEKMMDNRITFMQYV